MEAIRIKTPITGEDARRLKAGDRCLITGTVYTARDAAHKRLVELLEKGDDLPLDLKDVVIYYLGPSPNPPGKVIGSAGPTTAGRMDIYTPALISAGVTAMIGKGERSPEVVAAMKESGAVYFVATGGCGALLSRCIRKSEVVAYEDLGTEAIRRLEVEDMPLRVAIDTFGNNIYETGPREYLKSKDD